MTSVCPRDCPDVCGMVATVEDGVVTKVQGDPDHPITRGYLCGRFQHYEELIHHPDRLTRPLLRASKHDPFQEVTWDNALDAIATRFQAILDERGGEAILPYRYLGNLGIVSTFYADRLWNRMGTARVGHEICAVAGAEALVRMYGRERGTEPQHLHHTKLLIAWGKNPKGTAVHAWVNDLRHVRPRIVIDPFESETAADADLHLKLKPGTDSMLAIGLLRTLIEHDWVDHDFIARRTNGYEQMRARVLQFSLDEVERTTGIDKGTIEEVARLYHEHRPGLIHVGQGLQRNLNGGEIVSAICMLGAVAGQVGTAGGGVFYANHEWNHADITRPELRVGGTRQLNMNQLGRWLTEDDSIQALYVYNSNPAVTTPHQTLVRQGMARDDLFVVVHDLFLTDSAELANVVLPATSFAEHMELHYSHWTDYVQVNTPVIAPLAEARSNFATFQAIAHRMGYDDEAFQQTEEEVIAEALEGTGLDLEACKRGPQSTLDPTRTSFDDGTFPTTSGRIELLEPTYTPHGDERYPLRLLSPKSALMHGSQGANLPSTQRRLREPFVFIHPADAAGIADGTRVRVHNDRGAAELTARVSERTQPGVLISYNGRGALNALTSDALADLGGQSTFQSTWVDVTAA